MEEASADESLRFLGAFPWLLGSHGRSTGTLHDKRWNINLNEESITCLSIMFDLLAGQANLAEKTRACFYNTLSSFAHRSVWLLPLASELTGIWNTPHPEGKSKVLKARNGTKMCYPTTQMIDWSALMFAQWLWGKKKQLYLPDDIPITNTWVVLITCQSFCPEWTLNPISHSSCLLWGNLSLQRLNRMVL